MIETQPREIARGKTKVLVQAPDAADEVEVHNMDFITAGDGARKDSFLRKGEYSTQTNDSVFTLLNSCGVPTAYVRRTGPSTFRAKKVRMLPYEAVGIFKVAAASSARKRDPSLQVGQEFMFGKYALFLKTTGKTFGPYTFEKDDPFITSSTEDGLMVCRPDLPVGTDNVPIRVRPEYIFPDGIVHPFDEMQALVGQVGNILSAAWAQLGCTLYDFKIELAFLPDGELVVADVIDNDSWRLVDENGQHLDKQRYRDKDTSLEVVAALYAEVAARSEGLKSIRW